jgi:hypothetical protein
MGTRRRESSSRAIQRTSLPPDDRPTLIPCPVCEGQGKRLIETQDGRYRANTCRWCDGKCFIDQEMHRMFRRWLRIYNHNNLRGLCRT